MVVCGTGHRPDKLWGYNLNHYMYRRVKEGLKAGFINLLSRDGELTVISGMALGFDTLFAQAALELRDKYPIKLICAIPCWNHSSRWLQESKVEWKRITDIADEVIYVTKEDYTYKCMQLRNEYMVDNSDVVITLWNGTAGGTKNCIDYAIKQNKEIIHMKKVD